MKILLKNTSILQSGCKEPIFGSVLIENDLITHVGDIKEVPGVDKIIDGSAFVAIPGLVNSHTHCAMSILRNSADDLSFDDWLYTKIIPNERKLSAEDIYWGTLLGICEMVRSGVTCFNDMYMHTESVAQAVYESGIRANLSYGPVTSAARGEPEFIDESKCLSFINKWHGRGNILSGIEIHSMYLYDKKSIIKACALAKSLGISVHTHFAESLFELEYCREKYNLTPVEAAYECGMFEVPVVAAHCVHISDSDIGILKSFNVSPVHCPSSNLKLGNGFAPVKKMIDAGLNVCIGTDGCASNNNLNMLEEMHLAALIHKGLNSDPQCMPASLIIDMATVNGAKAAGFDNTGSIIPGNKADISLIDISKVHMSPVNNIKSSLIYSAQASDVDTVIVGGKILMENRVISFVDEDAVIKKVKEITKKLS